jgi:hypothetical protein
MTTRWTASSTVESFAWRSLHLHAGDQRLDRRFGLALPDFHSDPSHAIMHVPRLLPLFFLGLFVFVLVVFFLMP